MRRVLNPPNPFDRYSVEWLGEPPPAPVEVYEESARSILATNDSPDIPFRWSVNPYRGCQHACAYCYARRTHEYLGYGAGTDFDTRIVAKINAPELLADALARPRWRREMIAFSGVTDCYQPVEAVYQLTRRCLEVCRDRANPIGVVTKSYLVTRDIDILADLARRDLARVYISIPIADEAMARAIEPHAPRPSRRLDAIKALSDAGVPTGVMVAPIIPGLSDRGIATVLEHAAKRGARYAGFIPLRLPGAVREVFFERLAKAAPEAVRRVEARIRDLRGGRLNDPRYGERMRGAGPYWDAVHALFQKTASRVGLDTHHRDDACEAAAAQTVDGAALVHGATAPPVAAPAATRTRPHQLPLWVDDVD